MKSTLLLLGSFLLFTLTASAQAPESFKYQAVARDAGGQILANQAVGFRISLLQGSSSGTTAYSETHAANTNAFGLVNMEIGNGTVVSGNFAAIDWGADTYFVQIEMDETGGSNYQLLGSSQLLSVPYALYSQQAENGSKKYQIGDLAQGGIIAWVDETGEHGLVAAPTDLGSSSSWWNGVSRVTSATGDGVGAGNMNTTLIIALQNNDNILGSYAAKLCAELMVTAADGTVYGDWYLPSKYELDLLYSNLRQNGMGGFSNTRYWSSTEFSTGSVWLQSFSNGSQSSNFKNLTQATRAVRIF